MRVFEHSVYKHISAFHSQDKIDRITRKSANSWVKI